jgi:hypothetical protein
MSSPPTVSTTAAASSLICHNETHFAAPGATHFLRPGEESTGADRSGHGYNDWAVGGPSDRRDCRALVEIIILRAAEIDAQQVAA